MAGNLACKVKEICGFATQCSPPCEELLLETQNSHFYLQSQRESNKFYIFIFRKVLRVIPQTNEDIENLRSLEADYVLDVSGI